MSRGRTRAPSTSIEVTRAGSRAGKNRSTARGQRHGAALAHSPWPVGPWPKALFSAICDGLVHVPLSFYPQFYFVREVVLSGEQRSASEHFSVGLSKYRQNLWQDVAASAAVFVPVGIINFRYVPLVWRTPFCSAFGLLFPIIVSWQRGAQLVDGS